MRTIPVLLAVVAAASFAIACSDAPSTVQGGLYLFDAGGGMSTSSSSSSGSSATVNPNLPMACTAGGANSGNKWSDLYTCYFGATGIVGCAGAPTGCHGDATSAGGSSWICGTTQESCRSGVIAGGAAIGSLTKGTAGMMFTDALLYSQVCQLDSAGNYLTGVMPLGCVANPMQQLYQTDMARIQAWLQAGAPDN